MRVPKNIISKSKYTSGNEFTNNNIPYKGYYYELNNEFYAGKEFKHDAPKLVHVKNSNKMYNNNLSTAIFSAISGLSSHALSSPKINSLPSVTTNTTGRQVRFFCIKINENVIKEINEITYNDIQRNVLYKTTYIGNYKGNIQTLEEADKQLPGVKTFVDDGIVSNPLVF